MAFASVETTIDALPVASSVAVPIVVPPSLNVTVPAGTPVAGATGATAAVSVTACPAVDGFGVEVKVVVVAGRTKIFPISENTLVWTTLTPGPPTSGPEIWKRLFPKGLPVMVWSIAGSPMKPAGGAGAAASHVRNGPTLGWRSAREKSQAGGAAPHPRSSVKLIAPAASATKARLPSGPVRV